MDEKHEPIPGKLYRLVVENNITGEKSSEAFGFDLERNFLVCIPPTARGGVGPAQSFLVSGTSEVFQWCYLSDEDMLLRVAVKTQLYSSNYLAWLEEVDLSFAEQ